MCQGSRVRVTLNGAVIVDVAVAHGGVGKARRAVLQELAARAGLTPLDVRMLVDGRTREWDGRAEAAQRQNEELERIREHGKYRGLPWRV